MRLAARDDEQVVETLTKIAGIGRWLVYFHLLLDRLAARGNLE